MMEKAQDSFLSGIESRLEQFVMMRILGCEDPHIRDIYRKVKSVKYTEDLMKLLQLLPESEIFELRNYMDKKDKPIISKFLPARKRKIPVQPLSFKFSEINSFDDFKKKQRLEILNRIKKKNESKP